MITPRLISISNDSLIGIEVSGVTVLAWVAECEAALELSLIS